ncbi:MAG: copper resistance protein NlpE N-terminal domain-containing protein [Plesiomonas sp.]
MASSFLRSALALSVIVSLSIPAVQAADSHPTADSVPATLFEGYQGVLPCTDCDGIDTRIRLNDDGSFVETDTYLQGRSGQLFADYGRWSRQGETLILTSSSGDAQSYRVRPDSLLMLAQDGKPLPDEQQYVLQGAEVALPSDPMSVRGMYSPRASGAVLQDCATGLTFTLQGEAKALQAAYRKAAQGLHSKSQNNKGQPKPLLVELSAHFADKPDKLDKGSDSDATSASSVLVVDSVEGFVPSEQCQSEEE